MDPRLIWDGEVYRLQTRCQLVRQSHGNQKSFVIHLDVVQKQPRRLELIQSCIGISHVDRQQSDDTRNEFFA